MGNNIPSIPIKVSVVCACFKSSIAEDQVDGGGGDDVLQPETSGGLWELEEIEGGGNKGQEC